MAWSLLLAGCGPYVLRGKVVEGRASSIAFVEVDDPRLESLGLDGAIYELTLDPQSLARKVVATGAVEPDGSFAIPVEEFGAGLLEYEFGLVVRRPRHDSAVEYFRLPARSRRVLVTLAPGADRYRALDDPLRESQPFLRE
jgi:hypothetical protein